MTLPKHEMERLRRAATGRSAAALAVAPALDADEQGRFDDMVRRRLGGEPLQYIEGTVDFGPLTIRVDERALIPRPETEGLWEEAVRSLGAAGPGTTIVDVGTGSGCLALALKHAFPRARVIGIDVSPDALDLARENAALTGLDVEWSQGNLLDPLPPSLRGRVDLIVSNPPYVADGDELPPDVRDHEPGVALYAGPDGTEIIAALAEEAYWWLGTGGWALCEIGDGQAERALALFNGYDREVRRDLTGRERILVARKGASCCL